MATQQELDECYMTTAEAHAKLSKGVRAKVGACIVTKHSVILGGCNGLAPGSSNTLEYKQYMNRDAGGWLDADWIKEQYPHEDENGRYQLITKEETIHAELNTILKAAKEGVSIVESTLYTTLAPCLCCSEMIKAAGITRVVYKNEYRLNDGVQNLKNSNLEVIKL